MAEENAASAAPPTGQPARGIESSAQSPFLGKPKPQIQYPNLASDDEGVDRGASTGYLEELTQCQSAREVALVARQRVLKRSATELGATLQALRRLIPLGAERQPWDIEVAELLSTLRDDMKQQLEHMSSRSIANGLFTITSLRAADKVLLAEALNAIEQRVAEKPMAFRFIELAQVAAAYRAMRFTNRRLNDAITRNIMSIEGEALLSSTATDLVHDLGQINFKDANVFDTLAQPFFSSSMPLSPRQIRMVCKGAAPVDFPAKAKLLQRMQADIRKQASGATGALTAVNIMRELIKSNALEPATVEVLLPMVQEQRTWKPQLLSTLSAFEKDIRRLGYNFTLNMPRDRAVPQKSAKGKRPPRRQTSDATS